jgi:hypothetical protein
MTIKSGGWSSREKMSSSMSSTCLDKVFDLEWVESAKAGGIEEAKCAEGVMAGPGGGILYAEDVVECGDKRLGGGFLVVSQG